jgi:hypothetical protein
VGFWEYGDSGKLFLYRARERVEAANIFYLFIEELNANSKLIGVCREDVNNVPPHSVSTTLEVQVISGVLQFGKLPQDTALIDNLTARQMHNHLEIRLRVAKTIN